MLRRPKPTDSESDLLQEQERFLASGSTPAATVTKSASKRRGDSASADSDDCHMKNRDVVTIADLPDELPTLIPAPPKKSCSTKERVRFDNEDPEELLDRHDTHISAVLSRIVERDTSAVPVLLPAFTSTAFPKVLHHSTVENQKTAPGGRRSLFARHIAAQKAKTGCGEKNKSKVANTQASESGPAQGTIDGPLLVSGQGLGPDSALENLTIHQENKARLQTMSQIEILEKQKLLLAQLDPRLVDFVRSRKAQNATSSTSSSIYTSVCPDQSLTKSKHPAPHYSDSASDFQAVKMDTDVEDQTEPTSHHPITVEQLPIQPEKEWLHMDKLEPDKMEWMRDLPRPTKQATEKAMQARFNFAGILIPPTEDLPTHLGLHHHGEEPELAGYSLQELFLLSRSQLTQQRSLALNTLAHILSKGRSGENSCLKGNVVASLLDAGLLFLLRFSLDDRVEGVMSAAVRALRALLVSNEDEENLDNMFPWLLGMAAFPLAPHLHKDEDEDDEGQNDSTKETEKAETELDHDVAQQDVIKGLLKMQLLQRLRYILEVVRPSPQTVLDILEVLIRIARHSLSAATQILYCPRLMETVMSQFLPCMWSVLTSPTPPSLYGLPVSKAMKLLRVLGSAGRHICARILNSLGGKERLTRFLSVEPSELLLESDENILCSTEALRLWAVAASYGQTCNLYKDLYPVLVKALQAAHKLCAPSENLLVLELNRVKSLLVLLTQVSHTAGCHQELQSGLTSSQGADCLPPPPVTWSNVSGLQPSVMGLLKGCITKLEDASQRSITLSLLPSYMIYMGAYYSQLQLQSSFQPVQCLQELEALTTEVLLPLISHQVFHSIIDRLRLSSVICKAGASTSPQTVPSLPGLESSMVKITGPEAPLPLSTALFYLLDSIVTIHRGLTKRFSTLILSDCMLNYLKACVEATPPVSHASAWILRHEHHFVYLILRLAHRLVPAHPEVKKHASLFHQAALALLSCLLPGSEYLAYELMSTMIFNQDLFPEAGSGGPEAASLAELHLQEMSSHSPRPGPLLYDSLAQLPLIRACYLTHLAYLEPSVITSRERHLGRNPWLCSQLLPELSGPSLPSDWAFLPLISLYKRIGMRHGGVLRAESLPAGSLQSLTRCLQWLLVLESFRERALQLVPPVAKLAHLVCVFLCSSDIFFERAVKELTWALLRGLTRPERLEALDLSLPPPGLASFHDLYSALLAQYEAVSFGDSLFGCFILLPLQRRYSVSMRLALFGEHVSILRSLGVSLEQLPVALEKFTSPTEDSLPLLRLYFRALVTKALRRDWCPVLYVVAVAHLNAFIFSQDDVPEEVETTRQSLLRKTYYLTDEVLRSHLLLFCLPQQSSELGFSTYEQLTPIRAGRLQSVIKTKKGND